MHVRSYVADFVFFCGQRWIDADLVDDSKHSVTTCTEDGFSRVQAGKQDGKIEGQDHGVISVAVHNLNDNFCFP